MNPNFKQASAAEWNVDIQRAITNNLTVDVAYVGNQAFNEEAIVDLNQPVHWRRVGPECDRHLRCKARGEVQ